METDEDIYDRVGRSIRAKNDERKRLMDGGLEAVVDELVALRVKVESLEKALVTFGASLDDAQRSVDALEAGLADLNGPEESGENIPLSRS